MRNSFVGSLILTLLGYLEDEDVKETLSRHLSGLRTILESHAYHQSIR